MCGSMTHMLQTSRADVLSASAGCNIVELQVCNLLHDRGRFLEALRHSRIKVRDLG